jgi:hypothetical protein
MVQSHQVFQISLEHQKSWIQWNLYKHRKGQTLFYLAFIVNFIIIFISDVPQGKSYKTRGQFFFPFSIQDMKSDTEGSRRSGKQSKMKAGHIGVHNYIG